MSRYAETAETEYTALARFMAGVRFLVVRAGGLSLIALGLFAFVSLLTHDISDPSWSVATGRTYVANWGGQAGAVLSDVLLQMFGGAALVAVLIPAVWGWEAFRHGAPEGHTPLSAGVKRGAYVGAVFAAAGLGACLPVPADWPYLVGMGGLIGAPVKALAALPLSWIHSWLGLLLAAPILIFAGAWAGAHALNIRRDHVDAGLDAFFWCYDYVAAQATVLLDQWREARGERQEPTFDEEAEAEAEEEYEYEDEAEYEAEDEAEYEEEYEYEDGEEYEYEEDEDEAPKRKIIREVKKVQPRRVLDEAPEYDPGNYKFPSLKLLKAPNPNHARVVSDEELEERARQLESVLADFKIQGEIINVRPGPVVTLYELEPAAGVKSSRVIGLADDIARSMSAVAARVAVVPGRNAIGIELPNDDREFVLFHEMLASDGFHQGRNLTLALGKDIGGEPQYADLAKMPHLLIAGTTGSGKSVGINTMILSLLYRLPPDQCKLIMVDPKMLELSVYEGIPHLLAPVVTDPRKAVVALKWTVKEMEDRYRKMSQMGVRNIHGFNERVAEAEARGEPLTRREHKGYDPDTGEPVYEEEELEFEKMPFIVVVIDEVADLMMVAGKDIEAMVQRLAQMARAAGIHLIMATQRPSVDVITGTIKANFPTRISFQVTSKIDSRTILGEQGAEQLLGQGDMLYMAGGGRITRVHGAFVADDEVEKIVSHLKKQGKPSYVQEVTEGDDETAEQLGLDIGGNTSSGDAMFDQAVAIIARDRKASTSYIQRRLQIGYNRAATLMEQLEEQGIVGPANHAGKREILVGEDAA